MWTACLPPQPPGGPFSLKVQVSYEGDLVTIPVNDVLFGDVWVASGQSNMQFGVPGTFNFTAECAAAAHFPNVRLMAMGSKEAAEELDDVDRGDVALPWVSAAASGALCGESASRRRRSRPR